MLSTTARDGRGLSGVICMRHCNRIFPAPRQRRKQGRDAFLNDCRTRCEDGITKSHRGACALQVADGAFGSVTRTVVVSGCETST